MSYQPQYQYTPAPRAHHWLDLLLKVGGLLGGATAAAVMGVHMIHKYSPPTGTAPVVQPPDRDGAGCANRGLLLQGRVGRSWLALDDGGQREHRAMAQGGRLLPGAGAAGLGLGRQQGRSGRVRDHSDPGPVWVLIPPSLSRSLRTISRQTTDKAPRGPALPRPIPTKYGQTPDKPPRG